jgi:polyphenol oxidase
LSAAADWLPSDLDLPRLRAGTTLRTGGASMGRYASQNLALHVGDDPQAVAANRAELRARLGLPGEPFWLSQVHGTTVLRVPAPAPSAPVADAAFTRSPGQVLAVLTADCLPVVFAHERGAGIAIAHAGWRGLAAGVLEQTVAALALPPGEILAWLGPAIGPAAFEVGPEVRAAFIEQARGDDSAFAANARGRYQADLAALARARLARLGLTRVAGGGRCTHAEAGHFYSYRRDGETGRMATLAWLEA